MKYQPLLLTIFSLALILRANCGYGQSYVPSANEEFYGTWINDKSINAGHIQKKISSPEGNKDYFEVSDTVPLFEDTQQVYSKWTDSEGNIWYEIFGTVTKGLFQGTKWQELDKLSKSATVWEYVYTVVGEFDTASYPTTIDPALPHYRIFYRAEAASSSASGQEKNWTLIGSWINKSYETSFISEARIVYGDDGTMSAYQRLSDKTAIKMPYVIEKTWTESDVLWFKVKLLVRSDLTWYLLVKVSDGGNTLEDVHSLGDYPPKFDTKSHYYYEIRHRE